MGYPHPKFCFVLLWRPAEAEYRGRNKYQPPLFLRVSYPKPCSNSKDFSVALMILSSGFCVKVLYLLLEGFYKSSLWGLGLRPGGRFGCFWSLPGCRVLILYTVTGSWSHWDC